MAKPRVFISSTYYDLKNVRADLDRFIKEQGYEPVLNEHGNIPYGSEKRLEEYCYKEIELCDMLISIIGGRFGSESFNKKYSISQQELKAAIELNKPIYIFIEKNVLAEFKTFEKNKDTENIKYASVDDERIYQFIDEVQILPVGNPIAPFETASDITIYLKEQWSGLFQRLLQESSRQKEVRLLEDMKGMISTLKQMVTFLSSEKTKGDRAISDILLSNHPIFKQIKSSLSIPYRVFFTNLDEFNSWITQRSYNQNDPPAPWEDDDSFYEWYNTHQNIITTIKISKSVFEEDGKLKIFTPEEWDDSLVVVTQEQEENQPTIGEDVPF
jgi:hypothetical protein